MRFESLWPRLESLRESKAELDLSAYRNCIVQITAQCLGVDSSSLWSAASEAIPRLESAQRAVDQAYLAAPDDLDDPWWRNVEVDIHSRYAAEVYNALAPVLTLAPALRDRSVAWAEYLVSAEDVAVRK